MTKQGYRVTLAPNVEQSEFDAMYSLFGEWSFTNCSIRLPFAVLILPPPEMSLKKRIGFDKIGSAALFTATYLVRTQG